MAGPYPPHHGIGPTQPPRTGPQPILPARPAGYPAAAYPAAAYPAAGYPALGYPAAPRPTRSRRRLVTALLLAVAVLTVLIVLIGHATRSENTAAGGGVITAAATRTAIQGYLDALVDHDIDTVARNTLCGLYDAASDRRADDAVAKMSSDAFRKQFSRAEVTSIDKIVYLSEFQAQALFTIEVTRVGREQRTDRPQGVAQLLWADGGILVCSYVLRAIGAF